MAVGLSDGTSHPDEDEWLASVDHRDAKQISDQKEINANSTSGDFQSRFGAAETRPLTPFRMPVGSPTEVTGALKQTGGSKVPENDSQRESPLPDIPGPLGQLSLIGMAKAAWESMKLPGDVYSGKQSMQEVNPQTGEVGIPSQVIEKATDLAGLMVTGPAPVAARMADGTLGSFMGVKSQTLDKTKLYKAQEMEMDAVHPDTIWSETGTFRGADNRWRQEIDDSTAKLKPDAWQNHVTINDPRTGGETNATVSLKQPSTDFFGDKAKPTFLSDVLDHPELYKAYPDLAKVKVEPLPSFIQKDSNTIGHFSRDEGAFGTIALRDDLNPEFAKSVLLHEAQHAIQDIEGFAKGGNASQFLPPELPQAEAQFNKIRNETEPKIQQELGIKPNELQMLKFLVRGESQGAYMTDMMKGSLETLKKNSPENYKRIQNIVKSEDLIKGAQEEAFSKYQRLMGEVEARNTQARITWSNQSRGYESPVRTEDTPRMLQIQQ